MHLTLLEALRLGPGFGDADIRRALMALGPMSDSHKLELAAKLTNDDRDALDAFADRMASLAVRLKRPDLIQTGLDAVDIAWLGSTWGEDRALPLLYRACELLGLDAGQVFKEAAPRLHGLVRADVERFAKGEVLSIQDAGFIEGSDDEGFKFIPGRS